MRRDMEARVKGEIDMKELNKKQFVKPTLTKFEKPLDEVTLCWNQGSGSKPEIPVKFWPWCNPR